MLIHRYIVPALLTTFSLLSFACSGEGPDLIDPSTDGQTETAFLAVDKGSVGELAHYYEVNGLIDQSEYATVNGAALDLPIDAIYQAYENIYLHSNASGQIVVLDLKSRKKLGLITGFPHGDAGNLSGMAFSNLSQAWVIAYGSDSLYLVDARNFVLVRAIPLPGNPTSITTIDNRVIIGMENPDGSGAIGVMHSNDPDFKVEIVQHFVRPPFVTEVNPDGEYVVSVVPGAAEDDPATADFETDPLFEVVDLIDYSITFERSFFAPSMRDYVGRHPNYASLTKDSYLYLATSDGVKRLDTRSWGTVTSILPGKAYSVVAADYWTDLLYAVPTDAPTTVERRTKRNQTLPTFTLDNPVKSMRFVSTSKVGGR